MPANKAFARSSRKKKFATVFAGGKPASPKRASKNGWRVSRCTGARTSGASVLPVSCERFHQPAPRFRIATKRLLHIREIAFEQHRGAVIQRMRQHGRRMNPFESVRSERQRIEKRRSHGKRMNRGAEVVAKTRNREFQRPRSAARDLLGFKNIHAQSRLRENDRSSESVRSGTHDCGAAIRVFVGVRQFRSSVLIACSIIRAEP